MTAKGMEQKISGYHPKWWTAWGLLALLLCCTPHARGQEVAVKTNILGWASTTPNLGAEVALSPHWTLEFTGAYNPWTFSDNKKFKHYLLRPEARYWFWESFNGHFLGAHAEFSQFNVGGTKLNPFALMLPDTDKLRHEGTFYGVGISYGYSWILSPHWSLEAQVSAGYRRVDYRSYECPRCGRPTDPADPLYSKNYFGPTKMAVSLIYMIR